MLSSVCSLLLLSSLGAAAFTSPLKSRSPYAVKGSHPVPRGWESIGRAPASAPIELRIGLKQGRFDDLERELYDVSHPRHSRYGQHLTSDAVNELIKPSDESLALVHEWLLDHGIEAESWQHTPAKDWVKVKLTVSEIEQLLETEYSTYVRDDGLTAIRTPEWSLPLHLHEHISTIQPTNSFFGPKKQIPLDKRMSDVIAEPAIKEEDLAPAAQGATIDEVCDVNLVTPTCIRTLYGTIDYNVQSADQNTMALTNYLNEVNLRSDARLMLERYRPEAAGEADEFVQISIAGGTLQQTLNETQLEEGTGLEGNLDVQAMISLAWPTPLVAYSTGGSPPFIPDLVTTENTNEPYLVWLDYVLSQPDPLPSVISTSYDDDEQTVPRDYAEQVCKMMAQLGARGVTLLFSSGDSGIGRDGYCNANDGKNTSTFLPNFPSSCPYVTSVGGTYQFNPEVAVYRARPGRPVYTAGGGFSYYFKRPSYQDDAVPAYVENVLAPLNYDGLYDPEGRAYPDIAAQGLNYTVYWNGTLRPVSGTSMSSPVLGAVLTLVNDALLAAGKPVLGFLNPWLYSEGYQALNDIVSGSAAGCNTTSGFPAAPGWDGVTGWGTPNFPKMLDILGVNTTGCWGGK